MEHYDLNYYPFFIEFYLKSAAQGKAIMSSLLPRLVMELKEQGIENVAAVVNRKNHAASKVLLRSGFVFQSGFDLKQDLYTVDFSSERPAA